MTLYIPSSGKRITIQKIVSSATPVVLIDPSDKAFLYTVESFAVRLLGADASFDFNLDDGATDSVVAGADSFGTETFWHVADHHVTVEFGSTLSFTAGGSTSMHVTVIAIETDATGPGTR